MTFTVAQLLSRADLGTRSLTPGVGEDRRIEWAHVCELSEPWLWIGNGALVMTTGLGVPRDPEEQCAYLTGMHAAGIAAVTIGERMSAPALSPEMLACAARLDFPVLETAHATPFIALAMGVADEVSRADRKRVRATERLYDALRSHASDPSPDALLHTLARVLDAQVTLEATGAKDGEPDRIVRIGPSTYAVPLLAPGSPRLVVEVTAGTPPDPTLLQHAAAVIGSVLAVRAAARRRESLNGSLLLGDLLDESLPAASAARLLARQGIDAPFAVAAWPRAEDADEVDDALAALESRGEQVLVTARDGLVVVLAHGSQTLTDSLAASGGTRTIGLSGGFADVAELPAAHHQARIALTRGAPDAGVIHFADTRPASAFLPANGEQLQEAAMSVLEPLLDYDRARGTALVATLRVFLEENRSWVRSADRLYIHRQTLVSRIARIEQLTGRSPGTMDGAAELWFAVRAGVEIGLLPPSS